MNPVDETPLLIRGGPPYTFYRTKKDTVWSTIFVLLWLVAIVGGCVAWTTRNPLYSKITPDYLDDPQHCPLDAHRRALLQSSGGGSPSFEFGDFLSHAAWWLLVSIAASILIGVLFLLAVRHHAISLAKTTIAFQIAVPLTVALSLTVHGNLGASLGPWLLTGISAFVFYLWRKEIWISTRLLQVAGHGLAANTALIALPLLLNFAALFALFPLLLGAAIGATNGDVVPNPARQGNNECTDPATGEQVVCCSWQVTTTAMTYLGLLALLAAWTTFTLYQMRVYVVSGTVAQWYFAPVGTPTTGNMKRSLQHATGPAIGTNILAGLVLTLTQSVQQDAQQRQQQGDLSIFGFISSMLASLLQYLTKFAVVFSAISGEDLLTAGKRCTDLLRRNLLTAIATTVWFPSALMTLASFTLSVLWGTAVGMTYNWLHHSHSDDSHKELHTGTNAAVLGIIVGITTFAVLQFLVGVLLSVLDAVFVCWALDRDRAVVSNNEVDEAFSYVATEKGAVLQPQEPLATQNA